MIADTVATVYLQSGGRDETARSQRMISGANESNHLRELPSGTLIGRYRIRACLGRGGMGVVYQAEDTELNRTVALKLLPSSTPEAADRFRGEAQLAASLNHPNIVTVHDIGEYQGRPFFAMEHARGKSLDKLIAAGPLEIDLCLSIIRQLSSALSRAHQAGLIHRDIKPSNIVVDDGGRVKLLDFGLAGIRGSGDDSRSGTVAYMSPEQAAGEPATPRSDLFSLGVTAYEMVTGQRPFEGDYEAAMIYTLTNDDPTPLGDLREGIPEQLSAIIEKLLEKVPDERYQSGDEIMAELDTFAGGGKSPEQPTVARWRSLVFSLMAIAIITVAVVWFNSEQNTGETVSRDMLSVLPFDNLGSPDDEYFADGIVDAITTDLARHGDLGVISRSSAMKYRDSELAVREIGEELGCRYLVRGTVHWDRSASPSRVLVHARLVNATEDAELWADRYEGELGDIFTLQNEIARDVATALQVVLRDHFQDSVRLPPTADLQAYDFYLRGNQYFNRSWEQDDIEIATTMYARAVELDPKFALAQAMLSRGHESMYWEYYDHSVERREQSLEAANLSLKLVPDLVEGNLALGYYYYHCELDYERALTEFRLALDRWPNNADLHSAIGAVQRRIGPIADAVDSFRRASMLDPRSHLKLFDVGLTLGMMRRYEPAEHWLDQTIALAPDWPIPHVYKAWLEVFRDGNVVRAREVLAEAARHADLDRSPYYWWLARVVEPDLDDVLSRSRVGSDTVMFYLHCAEMNRLLDRPVQESAYSDSARTILESRRLEHPDNARYHSHLGLAYAGLGQKEKALTHSRRAMELLPTTRDGFDALFYAVNLAEVYVVFDEQDAAIAQLRFLLNIPGFVSAAYLELDPLWLPLHNHPEWPSLISAASDDI